VPRWLGPLVLGNAIDNLRRSGPHASLLLSGTRLRRGDAQASGFWREVLVNGVSRRIEIRVAKRYGFAPLQRLELAYFQHRKIGDLVARASTIMTAVKLASAPASATSLTPRSGSC